MRDVESYVEGLFRKYKRTREIDDLHEEVLSNLQARIKDNMDNGLDYNKAYEEAIKNINDIDMLIDGNRKIYINAFKKEMVQVGILYTLITWIITIPLRLNIMFMLVNTMFMIAVIVFGLLYILFYNRMQEKDLNKIIVFNTNKLKKARKYTWIIWSLFMVLTILLTFSLHFASNIWFSRPIHINGPYEFAIIALRFFIPLVSIIIPLFINKAYKLINEYEVS